MTADQAWALEVYWGWQGTPPLPDWRCCGRCGDFWPPEARYWRGPGKRLCRACKNDERRGIWPGPSKAWHRKNRWRVDGHLERRCCTCREWKPLTEYYLLSKMDKPHRTQREYPSPECIACTKRRAHERKSIPQLRRRLSA